MNTQFFDISSIGFLSQSLQTPIAKIRAAADRLGIRSSSINGVVHFCESDVERIREALLAELRLHESHVLDQRAGIS